MHLWEKESASTMIMTTYNSAKLVRCIAYFEAYQYFHFTPLKKQENITDWQNKVEVIY